MKQKLYGFQCMHCFMRSGYTSYDPNDTEGCCGGEMMVAYEIPPYEEKNMLKKTARKEIAVKLRNELLDIRFERDKNICEINRLADRQRVLKKKIAELHRLIRELGFNVQTLTPIIGS